MIDFDSLPPPAPKARKLMSWVGFGGTDREGAIKLLTISASAGRDVHSAFAALTLLTWYGLILLCTSSFVILEFASLRRVLTLHVLLQ